MSDSPQKPHPLVALRINHNDAYDAVAMFVYLILVYGWGLWIYPLGRDFAHLANHGADLPFLARQIFAGEMKLFGANPVGYHLVNIVLMYTCMMLVYHFVNKTARGLWWFGTLAACLFMANPVHSETMHNLSGVGDLVPCLAGLAALTAYAWNASSPRAASLAIAVAASAFAAGAYTENAALGLVLLAYEFLAVRKGSQSPPRGILLSAVALAAAFAVGSFGSFREMDFGEMFAPLYLVFYPIGFLPETVEGFHDRAWSAWLAVAAIAVVIGLIHRKAKRPVFLFAIVGMVLLRIAPMRAPVDLTHMIGGGQLLLPNVLFALALIIIVFRIMDHPRWRVPMISITTTLVVIFFVMQWRSIKTWHDAASSVREFQAQALKEAEDGESFGVLPDFQYYRGAPVCLSESISFNTPFSKSLNHTALLPLHPDSLTAEHIRVAAWSRAGGEVLIAAIEDASLYQYFPNAGEITLDSAADMKELWGASMPDGAITMSRGDNSQIRVKIAGKELPTRLLPGSLAGEEADGKPQADADQ